MAHLYFDYAEQPIKQMLSKYMLDKHGLECTVDSEYDVLGFEYANKSYKMYLSLDGTEVLKMSNNELETIPKVQEAAVILYNAMQTVFMPVLNTIYNGDSQEVKDDIGYLTLQFNEVDDYFYLQKINRLAMEQQQISNMIFDIQTELDKHGTNHPNYDKLSNYKLELITKYNRISSDKVNHVNNVVNEFNNNVENQKYRVYLCLSQAAEQGDLAMKRLPTFGLPFQDPDEETELDRFKKENNI